jgi:predicted nucleic acid-binding protein
VKSLIFDTGPMISLATNSLLWILEPLRKKFGGEFYITPGVKKELIDVPIASKKFKFEALQVLSHMKKGTIKLTDTKQIRTTAAKFMSLVNESFQARGSWLKIIHLGEVEAVAAAIHLNAQAIVVDERTLRLVIEDPEGLKRMLEKKLHTKIRVNQKNLIEIAKMTKRMKLIRSIELGIIAYELGLLDDLLPSLPNPKKELLQGMLWGMKIRGAAISQMELDTLVDLELRRKKQTI